MIYFNACFYRVEDIHVNHHHWSVVLYGLGVRSGCLYTRKGISRIVFIACTIDYIKSNLESKRHQRAKLPVAYAKIKIHFSEW